MWRLAPGYPTPENLYFKKTKIPGISGKLLQIPGHKFPPKSSGIPRWKLYGYAAKQGYAARIGPLQGHFRVAKKQTKKYCSKCLECSKRMKKTGKKMS